MKYTPSKIEKKWQKKWQDAKVYNSEIASRKPKKYVLFEFPYPSGAGLHTGHVRSYVASDVLARLYRAQGFHVLYPFGFDAFGLPAENYAIKMGVPPEKSTAENIRNFTRQVHSLGISVNWDREINTTDPEYYKWTQWLFLQFYKAGLAYEATAPINWCPKDKTGLANEEVIDGKCDRCGTAVEKKEMRQWFLKITAYAQQLIDGLKDLDWPEAVKSQQENWIGRSEGAEITFKIETSQAEGTLTVFTTRADTLFGATYLVIAPEHPHIEKLKPDIKNWSKVEKYINEAKNKTDLQRSALDKEKTGVKLEGVWATNPANGEKIEVWVADYVLNTYGTGAIMAVPAHDARDYQFAYNYKLPVREVLNQQEILVNSGDYDGMYAAQARDRIAKKFGRVKIQYKLRDWLFSRQRYWGEPIPLIHCEKCGIVPVPEKDLPIRLPKVKQYEPTGTGESPLAAVTSWVNTHCPNCDGHAKRETNTMPQWAGSSWYYLRYTDPDNAKKFADMKRLKYWLPVDIYFGGMEHTTLHLLYSRFWNLFLYDQGLVPVKEPYKARQPHGIILGPDGEKMSKSKGNIVNPDEMVKQYGADTLRMFEMFLGPHEQMVSWNEQGAVGVYRFLHRSWNWVTMNLAAHEKLRKTNSRSRIRPTAEAVIALNRLIKTVGEDIEAIKFNTAVSSFMSFMNEIEDKQVDMEFIKKFLIILSPFAPHIAEELWEICEFKGLVVEQKWPKFNASKLVSKTVQFVVQVNGKFRANIIVAHDSSQKEVEKVALAEQNVTKHIAGVPVKKVIFIPNKIINFVV
jgi:leucyl-tRNA synthetase